jgi:hypothetical protein
MDPTGGAHLVARERGERCRVGPEKELGHGRKEEKGEGDLGWAKREERKGKRERGLKQKRTSKFI